MHQSKHIIEVYRDEASHWRWRKRARKGGKRIVSCSGESFYHKSNAMRAAYAERRGMIDKPEIRAGLT